MRFAVIGNTHQASKASCAERLFQLLAARHAQVCVERDYHHFLTSELGIDIKGDVELFEGSDFHADIAISLGGDGTFLHAAGCVGAKSIPILGINTGRLGFLSDVLPEDMEVMIDEIYGNHYKVEERSVLQMRCNGGQRHANPYALNEVAVMKHDSSSMITIHTYINNAFLNTYQADGLIIASPTGSTGYSLSVGGPIIAPSSKTMAITPIAPHSLNCRPFVICDDWEVTLEVESRSHNFLVAVDGRSVSYDESARIRVSRAPYTIKTVNRFNRQFFETLRDKMMWGADVR